LDEVETTCAYDRIEIVRAQLDDPLFKGGDAAWCVGAAHDPTKGVVEGWIHHDHHWQRHRLADGVQRDTTSRAECLGVE
jgi:hypothetical protein